MTSQVCVRLDDVWPAWRSKHTWRNTCPVTCTGHTGLRGMPLRQTSSFKLQFTEIKLISGVHHWVARLLYLFLGVLRAVFVGVQWTVIIEVQTNYMWQFCPQSVAFSRSIFSDHLTVCEQLCALKVIWEIRCYVCSDKSKIKSWHWWKVCVLAHCSVTPVYWFMQPDLSILRTMAIRIWYCCRSGTMLVSIHIRWTSVLRLCIWCRLLNC